MKTTYMKNERLSTWKIIVDIWTENIKEAYLVDAESYQIPCHKRDEIARKVFDQIEDAKGFLRNGPVISIIGKDSKELGVVYYYKFQPVKTPDEAKREEEEKLDKEYEDFLKKVKELKGKPNKLEDALSFAYGPETLTVGGMGPKLIEEEMNAENRSEKGSRMAVCKEQLEESGLFDNQPDPDYAVLGTIANLERIGFFDAPASSRYHGNYPGGLFDHSLETEQSLLELTEKHDLKWQTKSAPYIIGLLHDLCKCDAYVWDDDANKWTMNPDCPPGHGDKSVFVIMEELGIDLSWEAILAIRWHMGAYDKSRNWKHLGDAIDQYSNVLFAHTADMFAAKLKGI